MMQSPILLLLLAVSLALAAPVMQYDDYSLQDDSKSQMLVPHSAHKRAALVLDRVLIALQRAMRDDGSTPVRPRPYRDAPRTSKLRVVPVDTAMVDQPPAGLADLGGALGLATLMEDKNTLQRRAGAAAGRGRVIKCYFNAITCF